MSVLKQDESEWVDDLREAENVTLFPRWRKGLLSTIDRLVAEVERLRELNEMLAGVVRRTAQDDTADCDGARDYVIAALSALNPSGPNSSGGET